MMMIVFIMNIAGGDECSHTTVIHGVLRLAPPSEPPTRPSNKRSSLGGATFQQDGPLFVIADDTSVLNQLVNWPELTNR